MPSGVVSFSAQIAGTFHRVEEITNAVGSVLQDVGVDHRDGDVAVAEELLNGADVVTAIEDVWVEARTF